MVDELENLIPIEWPKELRAATQASFHLTPSNTSSMSPMTGGNSIYGPNYQRFVCRITSPQLTERLWRQAEGIIAGRRGMAGPLRMVDYNKMRPMYVVQNNLASVDVTWSDDSLWESGDGSGDPWTGTGFPTIVIADEDREAGERSLALRGFPTNIDQCLWYGDLGEVRPNGAKTLHSHLYQSVRVSRSNSAGKLRWYFEPGLRAAVRAGDQIVLKYPQGVFKFPNDGEGLVNRSAPLNRGNFGMSLIEVLPSELPPR